MTDNSLKQWLDNRLDTLRFGWKPAHEALEKIEKNVGYFLRPFLDSLGHPYTFDSETGESVIPLTPEISIVGQPGYNTYDFKAKIKTLYLEKKVAICNPYIGSVSVYLPLLKQAIDDLNGLYDEMISQTKLNKRGELLATIIRSAIDSQADPTLAEKISVMPVLDDDAVCEIRYHLLTQNSYCRLNYSIKADFENYENRIDNLMEVVTETITNKEILKLFNKFIFGETKIAGKKPEAVDFHPITSYNDAEKIRYKSQKVLDMDNTASKYDVGNSTVHNALKDCGYKYYVNQKKILSVVLTEDIKIVRNGNTCFMSHKGKISDKGHYINNNEFALFLRIIAKLPELAFLELIDNTSFQLIVTHGISRVMRDYFLPPFCSVNIFNNQDCLVFSNPYAANDDESMVEIQMPVNNKRFISTWWAAIKNANTIQSHIYVNKDLRLICDENYNN